MIRVSPLKDKDKNIFQKLFSDYYAELGCTDDTAHLVGEYVLPDLLAGLLNIDLIDEDGRTAGFIIYQIDDVNNEWNLKEGWGDIREIYIVPSLRRRGLGKFLLYSAEMKLKEAGAPKAYCLPQTAAQFFSACGYADTSVYCDELDCNVFEKNNLNNCCNE